MTRVLTDLFPVCLQSPAEQRAGQPAGRVGLLGEERRAGQQTAQTAAHQQTTGLLRVTQPLPLLCGGISYIDVDTGHTGHTVSTQERLGAMDGQTF